MTTETTDRAALADTLHRIVMLKDQRKAIDEELSALEGAVKAALEDDPTPIVDGERGLTAELKPRRKPAEIDLISAAQKPENAEHIVRAASMGLLSARLTALRQQRGNVECADYLLRYQMPAGETYSLLIDHV